MSLASGTRLGPYEILTPLGAGGMGEVYRARDTRLGREVALKTLPAALTADPDQRARFEREARAASSLNHPHICVIHDVGSQGGIDFLVMELLDGETAADRLARGPMPVGEVMRIGAQMADALDRAHKKGLVHRDLKPANIMLVQGGSSKSGAVQAKLLDFGLARPVSTSRHDETLTKALTAAGTIVGTFHYMSPEQVEGREVDARSDIWSLGATLYEMATGARAFEGASTAGLMSAVLRDEPRPIAEHVPLTPPAFQRLVSQCLAKDPENRWQSAGDVMRELEWLSRDDGSGVGAPAPTVVASPAARRRRAIVRAAVAAVLVVTVAAIALAVWLRGKPAADANAPTARAGRSIAVLPFINSSGNADDEYFADGMTDELIASLGKVPGLHVAARSSAFSFKGQKIEIREIARKLGVDTVLEGTVRRSGRRLRVTASLVSASDGLQIWSSTFDNEGGDAFAVQDDVTRGVVSGLSLQLAGTALSASQAGRTKDPDAHDLFLRGLASANAASEADLRRALELYQQAIARDSRFALAYAGISWVYIFLADAYMPPAEAYPKARAAAEAALERDSQVADAHALLAYSKFGAEWEQSEAVEQGFARAVELDPNSANTAVLRGAYWCFSGRTDEALADLDRAAARDPLSPLPVLLHEFCNFIAQRFPAVIEAHRRTQKIDPTFVYLQSWVGGAYRELGDYQAALSEYAATDKLLNGEPQFGLALTYLRMGRDAEARDIMRRMDERARTQYVPYYMRAVLHGSLGDPDTGVALLQKSVDARELFMLAMRSSSEISPLLKDPRAQRIFDQADAIRKKAR